VTEAEIRAAIVAEALSWEGTPYAARARIKGLGVDCAMLPAVVYHAVGLIPELVPDYTQDWMMHRDEELFLSYITPYAREITAAQAAPGDLVIWRFGRTYSHSAIVIDLPVVLHAVIRGGAVVRGDITRDSDLIDRPRRFFSLFGQTAADQSAEGTC
jgi:cell wall-associated NlpC family hydrolase